MSIHICVLISFAAFQQSAASEVCASPGSETAGVDLIQARQTHQMRVNMSHMQESTPQPQLVCPQGTEQVGDINADIAGCGLTRCDQRYAVQTIDGCKEMCTKDPLCVAFNWSPMGGDKNHMSETVCTLYDNDKPDHTWGPNQIFCKQLVCPPDTKQVGDINADIVGCGLSRCDQRPAEEFGQTIKGCRDMCFRHPRCVAFNWSPNYMGETLCTLYDKDIPDGTAPLNLIFCKLEQTNPKWRELSGNRCVDEKGHNLQWITFYSSKEVCHRRCEAQANCPAISWWTDGKRCFVHYYNKKATPVVVVGGTNPKNGHFKCDVKTVVTTTKPKQKPQRPQQ